MTQAVWAGVAEGGVAGRHVEHDTTAKADFNPLNVIGTKLSHLCDFRGRPASIATSPFISRRPARVFGPFQVQMSDRVGEEGVKTPHKTSETGWERGANDSIYCYQGITVYPSIQPNCENPLLNP
jgi:hypothetical protein